MIRLWLCPRTPWYISLLAGKFCRFNLMVSRVRNVEVAVSNFRQVSQLITVVCSW